jgi:Kef-type K+ transport system membrane component KefB
LKANLLLSSAVALTGIAVPIGLSYTLQPLLGATAIQAFAAGAALCSTSLGTTFTVLASSGLSSSRLGIVLTSAAMMDDVVGLVMVQVISNLGKGDIGAVVIVRPVLVSVAFAVIVPLLCRLCVKPSTIVLNRFRKNHPDAWIARLICLRQTALIVHSTLLLGLVAGASYAGTSNLFAAYLAGAVISWWDSEVPHAVVQHEEKTASKRLSGAPHSPFHEGGTSTEADIQRSPDQDREGERNPDNTSQEEPEVEDTSGTAVYERYYQQAVSRILQPLFFASIGFSIPITRMFRGSIVWRGIVYTILMVIGKFVCGLWLLRFSLVPLKDSGKMLAKRLPSLPHLWGKKDSALQPTGAQEGQRATGTQINRHTSPAQKPFSLHPPLILACAMTARGEIGFLISSVAESNGVFSSGQEKPGSNSDVFLIVTWAIVLCTVLGPLGVGLSVRRVKRLEEKKNRQQEGTGRDVLGVWGVN